MHQDQPDAERREQVQVVQEPDEAPAIRDRFAAEADDEGAPAKGVHVGCGLAEPAHESFRMRRQAHWGPRYWNGRRF
ncbi:hypothetical protein D3C83_111310 [compost metagenome]